MIVFGKHNNIIYSDLETTLNLKQYCIWVRELDVLQFDNDFKSILTVTLKKHIYILFFVAYILQFYPIYIVGYLHE